MKKLATVLLAVSLAVSSVAPVLAKDSITDPNKPSLAPGTVIYPVMKAVQIWLQPTMRYWRLQKASKVEQEALQRVR